MLSHQHWEPLLAEKGKTKSQKEIGPIKHNSSLLLVGNRMVMCVSNTNNLVVDPRK
jgi:hypothetical protein